MFVLLMFSTEFVSPEQFVLQFFNFAAIRLGDNSEGKNGDFAMIVDFFSFDGMEHGKLFSG